MTLFERILYAITAPLSKRGKPTSLMSTLKISPDHWIDGVRKRPIAGGNLMLTRRFLVIHHTAGWGADTSIDYWMTKAARGASAHVIIDRDGTITQCRPFNRTAGHAGFSKWVDPVTGKIYTGLNACSIGIELANCGDLDRAVYPNTCGPEFAGKDIPRLFARHKYGGPITLWERYTIQQTKACEELSVALVARYHLDDLVGHDDIAPDRKVDPGPAFPMDALRHACGFLQPLAKL
jgi:N-acetylmuramoyl-L-alanine amidase